MVIDEGVRKAGFLPLTEDQQDLPPSLQHLGLQKSSRKLKAIHF